MRFRLASVSPILCATAIGAIVLGVNAASARAQAALDDDDAKPSSGSPSAPTGEETHIGVAFRIRDVTVPKGMIQLFVDTAPGGSSQPGFGFELFRRKGNFEVQFGLEYESINVQTGIWVQKDKLPPAEEVDYVQFHNFGWVTAEVTFLNHTPITKFFALRYGGGAGIGIFKGSVNRTDYVCTDSALSTCTEKPFAANHDTPYNLPPVFPVINAIIGVQIRPVDNFVINIETGIRTLPFFGTSIGYMF
jgi:hypothetical protein